MIYTERDAVELHLEPVIIKFRHDDEVEGVVFVSGSSVYLLTNSPLRDGSRPEGVAWKSLGFEYSWVWDYGVEYIIPSNNTEEWKDKRRKDKLNKYKELASRF